MEEVAEILIRDTLNGGEYNEKKFPRSQVLILGEKLHQSCDFVLGVVPS